jgi:glutamate-1-semialdehyde 2,1-aminomutase
MSNTQSHKAYQRALKLFPGGVNSPVRAFKNVDNEPVFIKKGTGAIITDLDNNEYIDFVLSWGPLILGHRHPDVEKAVIESLQNGWTYGAPCEIESDLADVVIKNIKSIEKLRFVSSGTEAAMGAIRLARGATNRDIIIKCDGGYHGHSDGLLVSAGSGLATFGTSSSAGVPEAFAKSTIVIPMNDTDALQKAFENYPDRIAAFICEPVAGNVGVIPPVTNYLKMCKEICHANKALLIFDEVMTGFRVSMGGAQSIYDVTPDITVLGKVVGGGFPVGAYGASKELMNQVSPEGNIYQAGTLSGNPVAMTAGLKTLQLLDSGHFKQAVDNTKYLHTQVKDMLNANNINFHFNSVGTMFSLFLGEGPIDNYADVCKCNDSLFKKLHAHLLKSGFYIAPSAFEAGFMSSVHTIDQLNEFVKAIEAALTQ